MAETTVHPPSQPFPPSGTQPLVSGGPRRVVCPHKKTDFRHALWARERKFQREKARKTRFKVEMGRQPRGNTVTVDTSKARSNIDVLRLCLKELNWREVSNINISYMCIYQTLRVILCITYTLFQCQFIMQDYKSSNDYHDSSVDLCTIDRIGRRWHFTQEQFLGCFHRWEFILRSPNT